jgi:hypothetical protein
LQSTSTRWVAASKKSRWPGKPGHRYLIKQDWYPGNAESISGIFCFL